MIEVLLNKAVQLELENGAIVRWPAGSRKTVDEATLRRLVADGAVASEDTPKRKRGRPRKVRE